MVGIGNFENCYLDFLECVLQLFFAERGTSIKQTSGREVRERENLQE